jgi:predicted dinucleotide-binding enzyme
MKIGILGSGSVGQLIGLKLVELGHDVMIGTRQPSNLDGKRGWAAPLGQWLQSAQESKASSGSASIGTVAEAAVHGELLINATNGLGSLDAFALAGADNLRGKVVLDIANELDTGGGMPPKSFATDSRSLAEDLQAAFPDVRLVKTLNTMNAQIMVNPQGLAGGQHTVFVCGNDEVARAEASALLASFGWTDILDLGDLRAARGVEMLLPLWLRVWSRLGDTPFNFRIVRG